MSDRDNECRRRELERRANEAYMAASVTGEGDPDNLVAARYARRAAEYERELRELEEDDNRRW